MALGVLESSHTDHVPGMVISFIHHKSITVVTGPKTFPGTVFVLDDPTRDVNVDTRLKYDNSGPTPIILVPQPSDDPNDPLVRPDYYCHRTSQLTKLRIGPSGSEI